MRQSPTYSRGGTRPQLPPPTATDGHGGVGGGSMATPPTTAASYSAPTSLPGGQRHWGGCGATAYGNRTLSTPCRRP
eukprot:9475538-Pyramimonas_sp.AAC.1